jgi:hypothetical protein
LGAGIGCGAGVLGVDELVLVGCDVGFADELHAAVMDASTTPTTSIERVRCMSAPLFLRPGRAGAYAARHD